jgi:hypothetical protein
MMLPEDYTVSGMYLTNLISFFNIQLLTNCTNKGGETQDINRKDEPTSP